MGLLRPGNAGSNTTSEHIEAIRPALTQLRKRYRRQRQTLVRLPAATALAGWSKGLRLIVRKKRPHPAAQLRITDADGIRLPHWRLRARPGPPAPEVARLQTTKTRTAIPAEQTDGRDLPVRSWTFNATLVTYHVEKEHAAATDKCG